MWHNGQNNHFKVYQDYVFKNVICYFSFELRGSSKCGAKTYQIRKQASPFFIALCSNSCSLLILAFTIHFNLLLILRGLLFLNLFFVICFINIPSNDPTQFVLLRCFTITILHLIYPRLIYIQSLRFLDCILPLRRNHSSSFILSWRTTTRLLLIVCYFPFFFALLARNRWITMRLQDTAVHITPRRIRIANFFRLFHNSLSASSLFLLQFLGLIHRNPNENLS